MSEPFLAEVRIWACSFAPRGWALCNGQLLPIAQNTALYSLIGNIYGGDGRSTFALPNLQGRSPLQTGRGPGLSPYSLGQRAGTDAVTLQTSQIPSHTHQLLGRNNGPFDPNATTQAVSNTPNTATNAYQSNSSSNMTTLNSAALVSAGNSQSHTNLQPYLTLLFCIALEGLYPSRS